MVVVVVTCDDCAAIVVDVAAVVVVVIEKLSSDHVCRLTWFQNAQFLHATTSPQSEFYFVANLLCSSCSEVERRVSFPLQFANSS